MKKDEAESIYEAKIKLAKLAIAGLEKEFGQGSIFKGDDTAKKIDVISTGNFGLDLALGVGGIPTGRITEVFGAEGLGKTLIALSAVAEAQAAGHLVAYVDAEHALDPTWARRLGVNWEDLYIAQPDYGEQALKMVHKLAASGSFGMIIVDSVAALTPKDEINGEIGDRYVGLQARMMAQGLRVMNADIHNSNTAVVFVNQIRDKIGPMAMGGTVSPGGRALKFYSSVRIELKKMGTVTDKTTGEVLGMRVKANVIKNKVAPPFRYVEYEILHGRGFNNLGTVLEIAEKYGLIAKKGAFYYFIDEQGNLSEKSFGQGAVKAAKYLASDLELFKEFKDKISKEYVKRQSYYVEPFQKDEGEELKEASVNE